MRREAAIRPLAERSRLSGASVAEAAPHLGLSRSVLYEILLRYRQRPQTSSLLPWKRGRKPNGLPLDEEREAPLNVCIDEFCFQPERPSLPALHLEVRRRFARNSLRPPNYRTIRRRVVAVDVAIALWRRDGTKKANVQLRNGSASSLRPERLLDLIQVDHTLVDVMVVDRESRRPIGRPWLTLAIDVETRMIAGFHVSLWPPSTLSVCMALTSAVLPKTTWLADRELHTLDWPVEGLP